MNKNKLLLISLLALTPLKMFPGFPEDYSIAQFLADKPDNYRIAQLLANKPKDVNDYPLSEQLFVAVYKQDHEGVEQLIQDGANKEHTIGECNYTPLHAACIAGATKVVEVLLKHGANVNANTLGAFTPLHLACLKENSPIIQLLIDAKANLNAQSYNGNTPLHEATESGTIKNIETLLLNGANPNIKNDKGQPAYQLTRTT